MNAPASITITPVRVADLLAEGERMPVYVVAFTRMNTFLNLYGFARNIAMASLLGAVTLIVTALPRPGATAPDWSRVSLITITIVLTIIMFYRYLKFYRHYQLEMYTTYAEGE